jgi:hypothetical protein
VGGIKKHLSYIEIRKEVPHFGKYMEKAVGIMHAGLSNGNTGRSLPQSGEKNTGYSCSY